MTSEEIVNKQIRDFIHKKNQERNDKLKILCANISDAYNNCCSELFRQIENQNTNITKTKEFEAVITVDKSDECRLEDCVNFMKYDKYQFEKKICPNDRVSQCFWKNIILDSGSRIIFVGFLPTHSRHPYVEVNIRSTEVLLL